MKRILVVLSPRDIRILTKAHLTERVQKLPTGASFTLPDLIGSKWEEPFEPFLALYEHKRKTAGIEMGKLLGVVAREFQCSQIKRTKYGRKQITCWTKP